MDARRRGRNGRADDCLLGLAPPAPFTTPEAQPRGGRLAPLSFAIVSQHKELGLCSRYLLLLRGA